MGVFKAFYYDGISSLEKNLKIETKSVLNSPDPIIREYQIPGRQGVLYQHEGWQNVDVQYDVFLKTPHAYDMETWVAAVKAWMLKSPGQYLKLEDDFDPDHYRMAAYVSGLPVENNWRRFSRMSIKFSCEPFRYLKGSDTAIMADAMASSLDLYNPTEWDSLPCILIVHGMTVANSYTITVEYEDGTEYSQTLTGITLQNSDTYVLLDSKTQTVRDAPRPDYEGDYITSAEIAKFPILKPGVNTVSVRGSGVSSWGVIPRWQEI